jgi:toxin ParE1/3/4
MPVVFAAEALRDLVSIRRQIDDKSPTSASRIAVGLIAACDRLEYLPEWGRPGRIPATRELTSLAPYVILYELRGADVAILKIWQGSKERP